MTPQEAIDYLNMDKNIRETCEADDSGSMLFCEVLKVAISALEIVLQLDKLGLTIEDVRVMKERLTPKKVIREKCNDCPEDCDCTNCVYYTDRCPNCKEDVANDYGIEDKFCLYCGQALDWGDE